MPPLPVRPPHRYRRTPLFADRPGPEIGRSQVACPVRLDSTQLHQRQVSWCRSYSFAVSPSRDPSLGSSYPPRCSGQSAPQFVRKPQAKAHAPLQQCHELIRVGWSLFNTPCILEQHEFVEKALGAPREMAVRQHGSTRQMGVAAFLRRGLPGE